MSATTRRRLDVLQAARARQQQRKGTSSVVEDMRAMLEAVDGQADLDMRPGEDLFTVCVRRLQGQDGWTLAGIPGDTLEGKIKTIDAACQGKVAVSDEARHAARKLFAMYEAL
ncbi:MAG: hypothetical protein WAV85_15970 [Rhodoferax sp.]